MGKFSLACACLIAFGVNYVNFYAFSKVITLRNAGILEKIAEDAGAEGELKETIKLPMLYRSKKINMIDSYYVKYSGHDRV